MAAYENLLYDLNVATGILTLTVDRPAKRNALNAKGADGYRAEAAAFGQAFATEDFREGTAAFEEKRTAAFHGK